MKAFLIGILVIALAIVGLFVVNINNIPKLDEKVSASWSQVQNQYKRRADLIPNLVSTVKGYAKHEKDTFIEVTQARANVGKLTLTPEMLSNPKLFAQFQKVQGALSSSLSKLMLVVEKYPDLKANKNFLALQSQLEGTENRISVARRDYIQAVRLYNTELRTYPGKIIASYLYKEAMVKETFKVSHKDLENPKVTF